jgi:hypothetical protein
MTAIAHCPRRTDVAAFLLGALAPTEEHDTMDHVAKCADCRTTLAELVDIPELLARVPVTLVERMDLGRTLRSAAS